MGFSSHPDPKKFQENVWKIVRQVPSGRVTTYGQIGSMILPPAGMSLKDFDAFAPRWVGGAMANCPADVPWQRVINSQGKISSRTGANEQKTILLAEGITFDEHEKVKLSIYCWEGPDQEWCSRHGFDLPKKLGVQQKSLF